MLDNIIEELKKQDYLNEITSENWIYYSILYNSEEDAQKVMSFIKFLSTHSGVPKEDIVDAFELLDMPGPLSDEQNDSLNNLLKIQAQATIKIVDFQLHHSILKLIDLNVLSISRSDWNRLIGKFVTLEKHNLSINSFIEDLAAIQRVSPDALIDLLKKKPLSRKAKEQHIEGEDVNVKKSRYYLREGVNSLIYPQDPNNDNEDLEQRLADTGVRVAPLMPATPDRRNNPTKRTESGKKVVPVCRIGEFSLFKYKSPQRIMKRRSYNEIIEALPKLQFEKADPVEYTATLASIIERQKSKRRQSIDIMGETAADVFKAHLEIIPKKGSIHWAHLIAHFLTGQENIITRPDQELVNLVPSTAASNYNTLSVVELYIRDKLISKATNEIHIQVVPQYNDDSLIPESLEYILNWVENNIKCSETYIFNPNSDRRFTKKMHESFDELRKAAYNNAASSSDEISDIEDENDAAEAPCSPTI